MTSQRMPPQRLRPSVPPADRSTITSRKPSPSSSSAGGGSSYSKSDSAYPLPPTRSWSHTGTRGLARKRSSLFLSRLRRLSPGLQLRAIVRNAHGGQSEAGYHHVGHLFKRIRAYIVGTHLSSTPPPAPPPPPPFVAATPPSSNVEARDRLVSRSQ